MANRNKSVSENVPGDFFVDTTCIDCDTCRQIAPQVFGETAESAYVHQQPKDASERRRALQALVCCPTGSIGCNDFQLDKSVTNDFPQLIADSVFYCGFNSPKSFGGNSYFVVHPLGNWLIDSPKFLPHLAKRFGDFGGIANIFLTHRDDVADAHRYAQHFSSRRFIHRYELPSQPSAEVVLDGDQPVELAPGFTAIPTPGHTRGHCVLLFNNRFLFTGDHLDWDRHRRELSASRDYCWYSWPRQIDSMRQLVNFQFEWVLPGHGQRVQLPADEMRRELIDLVQRMENNGGQNT